MTQAQPVFWAMIAALFVQPDGCYSSVDGIDAWPESRDARLYSGNMPVIAHPPCQLWGALAAVNYKRWGGEHNRPGNDGGCFQSALVFAGGSSTPPHRLTESSAATPPAFMNELIALAKHSIGGPYN